MKDLEIPPFVKAKLHPEAEEMLRVYFNKDKGLMALVKFDRWESLLGEGEESTSDEERNFREVAGWSLLITDLVGHVANFMQQRGMPVDETIPTLLNMVTNDLLNGQNIKGTIIVPDRYINDGEAGDGDGK